MKLFVKSLFEAIFGKLIVERENWLNHLENSQELQFIYSKAFSVSLPHIARTLYFRLFLDEMGVLLGLMRTYARAAPGERAYDLDRKSVV